MITHLEKNRKISLILTLIIAFIIYLFSTIHGSSISSPEIFNLSYIYHFGIFFLFSLFLLITIKGEKETEKHHVFIVLIIAIIYAFLDELHQSFIPGRNASVIDLLTDTAGIFLSVVFYEKIKNMNFIKIKKK
ncbi:MAG TPA: VanZ family protein [Candidatus Nanoarchaeia archaeon]|nr:VanZ family protein [Candidatus Nanoarchaeia archaeon]